MKGTIRQVIIAMAALAILLSPGTPRARATARMAAPAGQVLYAADWSKGLDQWTVYRGFGIAHGMLTYDGSGDAGAFAPFTPGGRTSFAIEATLRTGTPSHPAHAAYDLFVRRSAGQDQSGLFAGYDAVGGEKKAQSVADLSWSDGGISYYVPGAALRPDRAFHTYRLEVRGAAYRLLVDGQVLVPWTLVRLHHAFDRVGLTFSDVPAQVTAFRVLALAPLGVTTTHDTSALLGRIIPAGDIAFPPDDGVFRDNARYALDNAVPLADLQRAGRVYGYVQGFQNSATYVEQSVNLHRSPAGAQAMFALFSARVRSSAGALSAYRTISTASNIGAERLAYSYQYLYQGSPSYVTKVLFRRGAYYVAITVDSSSKAVSRTAIALARLADNRVQG